MLPVDPDTILIGMGHVKPEVKLSWRDCGWCGKPVLTGCMVVGEDGREQQLVRPGYAGIAAYCSQSHASMACRRRKQDAAEEAALEEDDQY